MNLTVPIYQQRFGNTLVWTTLGLGPLVCSGRGRNAMKLQRSLIGELKAALAKLEPEQLIWLPFPRGIRLERLHLELTLRGPGGKRKVTGRYPVVVEPRGIGGDRRMLMAYHPFRQHEWVPLENEEQLEERTRLYFQRVWAGLADAQLDELQTNGKDRIKAISLAARTPSLLDRLPDRRESVWDDLQPDLLRKGKQRKQGGLKVLRQLGVDQTQRAADLALPLGMPRSPYREQLQMLLGGHHRRSVVVVGPPRCGKTTLIHNWINDLLLADGYEAHRNLDRVHHVWRLGGQRIISGMSYLGDWEQRCIDLLDDATQPGRRVVLWFEDLSSFGRLGRTRDSDRNLADLLRGPLGRGELTVVGECTPEQLQTLEDDAPSFAAELSRVHVAGTEASETLRMMLHEARALELRERVAFEPEIFRAILELTASLFPAVALPGKALEPLRALVRPAGPRPAGDRPRVGPAALLRQLSQKTGLPEQLIEVDRPLDVTALRDRLEQRVLGQPAAVDAACDLVHRIRAGLTAPRRPYAVYLFTGPTGVGKTELAKAIAEYLYGDGSRLARLDMGEHGDPDAAARLVGDQLQPRGLLTEQVQQQPFCVLLLDEIEKAHPSVLNLLLQLFDEGRLTDAAGTTADFTHAAIIMTSNLGARPREPIGFAEDPEGAVHESMRAVREFFPPELFNRIDRVIPFRPLTREVARRIAAKELSRLLARRGLAERNVLVYPTGRVLDRVVEQGFDPLLGARPVKRFLEQRIGTLLAERLSGGGPAQMQIVRLFCGEEGEETFRIHAEALTEAAPTGGELSLEPLLGLPARELQELLPAKLDYLDQLLESEELERLAERMRHHLARHRNEGPDAERADLLYSLDAMRGELTRLRGRMGYLRVKRRQDRRELLAALAEVEFLRRALATVEDLRRHAVFIELLHLGLARRSPALREGAGGSLMEALARAYVSREARGELEGHALRYADGTVEEGQELAAGLRLARLPEQLVLRVSGLGVLDFFEGETGCHIWRSLARGSDVLRVRVLPAEPGLSPAGFIAAHLERARAFEAALERGGALPDNPESLLPLCREYQFDPPLRPGESAPLEVVDYALGYAGAQRVKSLDLGLPRLWLLRMGLGGASEEGDGGAGEEGR